MLNHTLLKKSARFLVVALMLNPVGAVAADRIFVAAPAVPGDSVLKGFEGQIEATSVTIGAGGAPTAKAVLAPVVVQKPIDGTTPIFMEAVTGKSLGTLTVRTIGPQGPSGSADSVFTLSDARVLEWRLVDTKGAASVEQITFAVTKYAFQIDKVDRLGNVTRGTPRTLGGL